MIKEFKEFKEVINKYPNELKYDRNKLIEMQENKLENVLKTMIQDETKTPKKTQTKLKKDQ